jgi:hypothetical protein
MPAPNSAAKIRNQGFLLSAIFFVIFLMMWQGLTQRPETSGPQVSLSSGELAQLLSDGVAQSDLDYFATQGLTFAHGDQARERQK